MAHEQHTYICIDLKTFYASVECVDRGLDPLTTNLVVADESRGRTTICLAITQAMKDLGIHNRCRLFEIPDGIDYITAVPRMQHYMEVSAKIYGIYLEYVSPQDVHVYSIDECFIDVTPYLDLYHTDAEGLACTLRDEVLARTGITATVGIGPNLFQAKVALDVTAKHVPSRIGKLDDETFRKEIWPHRPITGHLGASAPVWQPDSKSMASTTDGRRRTRRKPALRRARRQCRISHRPRLWARADNHRRYPSLSPASDLDHHRTGALEGLCLRASLHRLARDGRQCRVGLGR